MTVPLPEIRRPQYQPTLPPMGAFSRDELAQFAAKFMDVVQLSVGGIVKISWNRGSRQFLVRVQTLRHRRFCKCRHCPDGGNLRHIVKDASLMTAIERAHQWLSWAAARQKGPERPAPYTPLHDYMVTR